MKKVLVTGGAGFIGSNFCNLNREKYEIVALDNLLLGDSENLHKDIKFIKGDACDYQTLQKCGKKFDIILHFAGTSSAPMFLPDFDKAYQNSINSFLMVLKFAKECGVKKVLYASTSSIYGNQELPLTEKKPVFPTNHYSASKLFYENSAAAFHNLNPEIETIGFRFMSVYGPNEESKGQFANVLSQFIWDFARGLRPIIFGDGEQSRDFTNVEDIIAAITSAIEYDKKLGNEIFNIGTGRSATLNEMITIIRKVMKTELKPKYIENPVKENYIAAQMADISKISNKLDFIPKIDLETGVRHQIRDLKIEKIKKTSSEMYS
jgi:UDP-glucose 4-epimerase